MDKDEFLKFIKQIGTTDDEIQRRDLLTQLSDKVVNVFDTNADLQQTNDKLTQDNKQFADDMETLRKANMQLFLRVGAEKTEEEIKASKVGVEVEEEKKPREFKDLFNEEGGLK